MKKTIIGILALVMMISLSGCGQEQLPETEEKINEQNITTDQIVEDNIIDEEDEEDEKDTDIEEETKDDTTTADYFGSWSRLSTTIDGAPHPVDAATVIITQSAIENEADKYESTTSLCTVSGDVVVSDGIMNISIKSHNCPGDFPTEYFHVVEMSKDGNTFTTTNTQFGSTIVEVFEKIQ